MVLVRILRSLIITQKFTKSNFKKFPTTDGKLFEYTLADDGDVNHIKITGIKSPDDDKLKVVVVPKTITVKTVDGNVKKTVVAVYRAFQFG